MNKRCHIFVELFEKLHREFKKPRKKVFAFFADLKSVFDKMDREILDERIKKTRISNNLRSRIMEIYKKTKNRIKIRKEENEVFWTE